MKVADFKIGDIVEDQYENIIEVCKKGIHKKHGPWLEVGFTNGEIDRYWDDPKHESFPDETDVKTLKRFEE